MNAKDVCDMLVAVMSKSGGKDTTTNKKWVSYFDALRVFAALAVVVIHVAARRWTANGSDVASWRGANFWDGLVRWAVPIFVMISGALMLNPQKKFSIKKLYSKNILRLVIAFIVWSLLYFLFDVLVLKNYRGVAWAIKRLVEGNYHLWFIYMIVGLYVATPVLRLITKNRLMTEYFLIVGIVISFILPGIEMLCNGRVMVTDGSLIARAASILGQSIYVITDSMKFEFAAGYVVYYVLGYWLASGETSKRMRVVYYILGVLGITLTIIYSEKVSLLSGTKWNIFGPRTPWVIMPAIALFVFAKYHMEKVGQWKIVRVIASLSFGVYLVHVMMIDVAMKTIFKGVQLDVVTIPLVTMAVFILSAIVVWLIVKVPILRRLVK